MLHDLLVLSWDSVIFSVLSEAIVNFSCLTARLGNIVLKERDLIVVAKAFQEILEVLIIDVMLLGLDLNIM
jgi:hypothetical protein